MGHLIQDEDGRVPLRWWRYADNFGDVLSRGCGADDRPPVVKSDRRKPHYVGIGSILTFANEHSVVLGHRLVGTEHPRQALRGRDVHRRPRSLSRIRLVKKGIEVPRVYGDPALLVPAYFDPRVEKTHKYGIVSRWSEDRWREAGVGPGVKLIDLGTTDVEKVITEMLSCRHIVTGSLHGLLMADAYAIPSAWVITGTADGGAFKFFDYFSTVNKFRNAQTFDFSRPGHGLPIARRARTSTPARSASTTASSSTPARSSSASTPRPPPPPPPRTSYGRSARGLPPHDVPRPAHLSTSADVRRLSGKRRLSAWTSRHPDRRPDRPRARHQQRPTTGTWGWIAFAVLTIVVSVPADAFISLVFTSTCGQPADPVDVSRAGSRCSWSCSSRRCPGCSPYPLPQRRRGTVIGLFALFPAILFTLHGFTAGAWTSSFCLGG